MKVCTGCRAELPTTAFRAHSTGRNRLRSQCLSCEARYQRGTYQRTTSAKDGRGRGVPTNRLNPAQLADHYELTERDRMASRHALVALKATRRWMTRTSEDDKRSHRGNRPMTAGTVADRATDSEYRRRGILAVALAMAREQGVDIKARPSVLRRLAA